MRVYVSEQTHALGMIFQSQVSLSMGGSGVKEASTIERLGVVGHESRDIH